MAAIVVFRSRDLKKAAKMLPDSSERKWHNTLPEKRNELLEMMSGLNFKAVYTVVDKNNPVDHDYLYGNNLYSKVLRLVVSDAMRYISSSDVNVLLDRNGFITSEEFRNIVLEEAAINNINPLRIRTLSSEQNKCLQLVDFIAGASRSKYEHGDNTIDIIKEKVSFARRL